MKGRKPAGPNRQSMSYTCAELSWKLPWFSFSRWKSFSNQLVIIT